MSGLRSFGDVLGGFGSLSGLGGAAGAAGGLAGLGFGPLAALTAIPTGLQLLGGAFGAQNQEKARRDAIEEFKKQQRERAELELGLNFFTPEAELARQGFGKAFDYELQATSPFATREKARNLSGRMFLQEEPGKAGYGSTLAGRFAGVV